MEACWWSTVVRVKPGPRLGLFLLLLATLLVASLLGAFPARARVERPAPVGSDAFKASLPYSGDFPDPTVVRVGHNYYAYGTTINYLNLPVLQSRDLLTWTARASNDPNRWWLNDAMPTTGSWSRIREVGRRTFGSTWAPHVIRRGPYFLAAYSSPVADGSRRCIGIAVATSPVGPFADPNPNAVVCPAGQGVIDPFIFVQKKRMYLLWKGDSDAVLASARLINNAGIFSLTGPVKALLAPKLAWEGTIVENPAMVRYRRALWLFYSGNDYGTAQYATGLAKCKSPMGPCKRIGKAPFMASKWGLAGPGGASPFFDKRGRLHLVYHAWRAGQTGYPKRAECRESAEGCAQRRMYVANVGPGKRGRLKLTKMYLNGP